MSWIEDEAARQALFQAKLTEVWEALKEALARDIADYKTHFGLFASETKDRGDNGFWIMLQENTDRVAGRRDIHVSIDFEKLLLTSAVTQTRKSMEFKILPDESGFPVFERGGKRFTPEQVAREILQPNLSKIGHTP